MAAGTGQDLERELHRIDGRGYKAYKDIEGRWDFGRYRLRIDHVQGDPFAAPSETALEIPHDYAGFPEWATSGEERPVALRDYLARRFAAAARRNAKGRRGSGKGGIIEIDTPGQEVLRRSAVVLKERWIEVRFYVGLPAFGRKVAGRDAWSMLGSEVPAIVEEALRYDSREEGALRAHVESYEDSRHLRREIEKRGAVAFIGDGAILPRRSGIDQRPMAASEAVPFESPESLRTTFELPNRGEVAGMLVPAGVTLICGGGYHGKSTLLNAIELGIYDHIPGDGRELVVATEGAAKVRAEDGRRVEGVRITPFISNLPGGRDTDHFSSEDASGSTSQAASIIESLEAGATALLIDEDTSATNFMIRDHRMQELIAKREEPITPFIDRVRQLYEELGISTVLVVGGSGDYFDVADTVVALYEYRLRDVTGEAREIARRYTSERVPEGGSSFGWIAARRPAGASIDPSRGKKRVKTRSRGTKSIDFGREEIDLAAVEQLVDPSQLRTISEALLRIREKADGSKTVAELLDEIYGEGGYFGRAAISDLHGRLASVRRIEVAAALNRLRSLRVSGVRELHR
ncbi:MAG: ABC-ATPase domain-containing protein [Spirochaetaceae bacterium]